MKRLIPAILIILMTAMSFPAYANTSTTEDLRGVWVATVLNLDYPSVQTSNEAALKAEAIKILDNVQSMGLNAVFLQVRPSADAFYKSTYFPWSKYLTGEQGKAPENGFDPLKFWVDEAHKRGIELHAWINPYRITKNYTGNVKDAWNQLVDTHIAKKMPQLVVEHTDGNLYFDPGNPLVRTVVAAGVMEIVQKYDVDGIHFDDYFYPSTTFNDAKTFQTYGNGFAKIDDWRRDNVTEMIKLVQKTIDRIKPSVEFGISPFGIWANKSSNSLGSDTKGNQSYYAHYADTRLWVKEGYIDYINPQIYWNIGYTIADYKIILDWWSDVVKGTDVKLYSGLAAYKVGDTSQSTAWATDNEIIKQLDMNKVNSEVDGSVFFRYDSIVDRASLKAAITKYYGGPTASIPVVNVPTTVAPISKGLTVTNPSGNINATSNGYFINGTSDPNTPLYINGTLVPNRSSKGYFGLYVNLKDGVNTFNITQSGQSVTRTISKNVSTWTPTAYTKAEITDASVYPQTLEMWKPGETVTLSCNAPIGSTMTALINNVEVKLTPNTTYEYTNGIYYTTFKGTYTIPQFTGEPRVVSLGSVVYNMNYKGKIDSAKAPNQVLAVMDGTPFMMRVTKDYIDSYFTSSSAQGSAYQLTKGMTDYVTGMTGDYVRLSFGYWVNRNDISFFYDNNYGIGEIKSYQMSSDAKWENHDFKLNHATVSTASFTGNVLTLRFENMPKVFTPSITKSVLFKSVVSTIDKNDLVMKFTLKDGAYLEGYIIENIDGGIRLKVKKPMMAINSSKPLTGITVLVDPGHGGSDPGALGILGATNSEKVINLSTSLKLKLALEGYGAKVVMTRSSDTYLSLQQRLVISRDLRPDMFISIHANSVALDRDINNVYGISAHYKEDLAKGAAQSVLNQVVSDLGRNSRNININNFYVVRGTWTPSLLVEMGFMPNPLEFEYMESEAGQQALANSIAKGIVAYFK